MTDSVKNTNGVKAFFIRTLADPILLYVTVVMTSIMYHYRSELAFVYGALTYVIGWVIFRIFDFINKHNLIGFFVYIILLMGFFRTSSYFITTGKRHYPITFGLWFLTPQDSLLYSKFYTMAIYTLFLIFMLSVIYYFTRVRYRMFMNFLILIIPFSIYGKEYEEMPIGFIIALAIGYVLILALFRQLSDTKTAVVVGKADAWKSAAVFTVIFALLSALIPKPEIVADRTALETLINADAFTDKLLNMLNVFRDSTEGEQFRASSDESVFYKVKAAGPMQIKTSTFTYYDYFSDSWGTCSLDKEYDKHSSLPVDFLTNGRITEAVCTAAKCDEFFAAKYGLQELSGIELKMPEPLRMAISSTYKRGGNTAPVPHGALSLTRSSFSGVTGLSHTGVIFSHEPGFEPTEIFAFEYEPGSFFENSTNRHAVEIIGSVADYKNMLSDCAEVLSEHLEMGDTGLSSEDLTVFIDALTQNYDDYSFYEQGFLEYGDNQQIRELAQQITKGLSSDYEKASALEFYFIDNGYVYDQTYRKEKGDNVIDFLFDTKKGVCYEYATSMTLLARAVGIPARYCEGFNVQFADPTGEYDFIVRGKDAHGFPELYIKGYGWLNFEPTMSNNPVMETNDRNASNMLVRSGIILLVISVLALILILMWSRLTHRIFLLINGKKAPNDAVKGAVRRIGKIYRATPATTIHETEEIVRNVSGADISAIAVLFERSQYGGETLSDADRSLAIQQYITAYTALNEAKKAARKSKKNKKARA